MGGNWITMANIRLIWAFFHSCVPAQSIDTFARRNSFPRVVTIGARGPHGFSVAPWRAYLLGPSLLSGSVMGTTTSPLCVLGPDRRTS